MKVKVGKEIPTEYTHSYPECPKCGGELLARNGCNSYSGFIPNAINYWQCLKCKRKFEVKIE